MVTLRPRASSIAASEADAMPLPREDTTPPVTKIYRVMKNLSKRDREARQKAAPGWDDRIAECSPTLNFERTDNLKRFLPWNQNPASTCLLRRSPMRSRHGFAYFKPADSQGYPRRPGDLHKPP